MTALLAAMPVPLLLWTTLPLTVEPLPETEMPVPAAKTSLPLIAVLAPVA